jgi:hypothetical protein
MAVFPQLGTGALSQFPAVKRRRTRTVVNQAADGSAVRLSDAPGGSIEWRLEYRGLTDSELESLRQFFTAMEGGLNGFTFLDPLGNLLARTEELNDTVWERAPLLDVVGGMADPLGGQGGWTATNTGAGPQTLMQTLNAPGGYVYCFSLYARASTKTSINLVAGNSRSALVLGEDWARLVLSIGRDQAVNSIAFGIEIPAGCAVDIFGPQVEAQPAASGYKFSLTGGVYEGARFRDDTFTCTTTDLNRHSATVNILYAEHL